MHECPCTWTGAMLYAADTMSTNRHDANGRRHETDGPRHNDDRRLLPVVEAAALLGITPDAVRARLRRGTLPKEQGPDGETLVMVEASPVG